MIVLSVGMPRAGSGWYYNLTHDLIVASGGQDARLIRRRYLLQRVLTEVNCNIGTLSTPRLAAVCIPAFLGNTFVIKAHAGPSPAVRRLIERGIIRPTYIYRDPRDAMLSAYENGKRALQAGRPNAFSDLADFQASLEFMLAYVRIWEDWTACDRALHVRYEDLLVHYDREVERLAIFLEMDVKPASMADVVERYRPSRVEIIQKGLHFQQGRTGRFREKWTPEQQAVLGEYFGPYLARMGYSLD